MSLAKIPIQHMNNHVSVFWTPDRCGIIFSRKIRRHRPIARPCQQRYRKCLFGYGCGAVKNARCPRPMTPHPRRLTPLQQRTRIGSSRTRDKIIKSRMCISISVPPNLLFPTRRHERGRESPSQTMTFINRAPTSGNVGPPVTAKTPLRVSTHILLLPS